MTAFRRRHFNFALERAVFWADELRKPLVVFEGLNADYRWASPRFHTFVIEGMQQNQREFRGSSATYVPYVEPRQGDGARVLHDLVTQACVVITDDFPAFEIPRWISHVAKRSPVLVEKVDSNGLVPMRSTEKVFLTAASFRTYLQRQPAEFPKRDPLAGIDLPRLVLPPATLAPPATLDMAVGAVSEMPGGAAAARQRMGTFLESDQENSGLSPYLHFGHLSAHEVHLAVAQSRHPHRERFLDQLTTWREIGFNRCALTTNYDRYESLPDWAKKTLDRHRTDERPAVYTARQLEQAETHDALWNEAQQELVTHGRIGSYLRMLWGKKILEWSATPEEALDTAIHLNNKYALDGRDPNSYTGIFWTFGRYDRPWGPERPIFGLIRYMSSRNTAIKLKRKQRTSC